MEGSLADRLFDGFWFLFLGEGWDVVRVQMAIILSSGIERSWRDCSTYVGYHPETSFPSEPFAQICTMVDSGDLVFASS